MAIKIENKITDYRVVNASADATDEAPANPILPAQSDDHLIVGAEIPANVVQMHERVERPEMLIGSTYKIKTPLSDHALYVTINLSLIHI